MNRVIVACHGFGQSPRRLLKVSGLADIANRLGAILYAPAGAWGGVSPYSFDMGQVRSFASRIKQRYAGKQIDLVGFSDGASFVATLAQTLQVNSVSIVAGVQQVSIKEPMKHKVLLVGGTDDPFVSVASLENWYQKYLNAGYPATLTIFAGLSHGWYKETSEVVERFLS